MQDQAATRQAIVAPAVATMRDGASMWEEFADAARDRGDVDEERRYRSMARRSRERAARLEALSR
jgi:hypothetical protein